MHVTVAITLPEWVRLPLNAFEALFLVVFVYVAVRPIRVRLVDESSRVSWWKRWKR